MIKKILFATDFSRLSRDALVYCGQLARRIEAEVVGTYALKLPKPIYNLSSRAHPDFHALEEEARQRLEEFFDDPALKGVPVRRHLGEGIPQQVISQIAEHEKAELVLLAKSSRTPVERFFVGSVTESVLRTTSRPVLVVPEGGAHSLNWRPIVCGVDFSNSSIDAFEHAVRFAARYRAELALVHVVDVEPELDKTVGGHLAGHIEEIEARLAMLAETCGAPRETRCLVTTGKPAATLVEAARRLGSDLLVIGSRGEFVERGMGAGSTVYGSLRASSMPVLVVP